MEKIRALGVSELGRLRPVEEEIAGLKRLVADLSLDKPQYGANVKKSAILLSKCLLERGAYANTLLKPEGSIIISAARTAHSGT